MFNFDHAKGEIGSPSIASLKFRFFLSLIRVNSHNPGHFAKDLTVGSAFLLEMEENKLLLRHIMSFEQAVIYNYVYRATLSFGNYKVIWLLKWFLPGANGSPVIVSVWSPACASPSLSNTHTPSVHGFVIAAACRINGCCV